MSLFVIILLPFLGSLCAAFLPSNARNAEAWLAGAVALTTTVLIASQYPEVQHGVVRAIVPWAPDIGLDFYLRMDGYAWLFALLVAGIGTLVVIYARYYMSPADPVPRFFAFLLAFMGAMLGVVLSGNLIQMAMFWELTSLASFMLIAYWHHRPEARRGARTALTVTGAGGLALLGGVLLLGHIAGSFDLDIVLAAAGKVQAHPWYHATLALIVFGALTKSAQFPFHFWLPHAMAAPTPVSAYLHSATMVKLGVFLLARLWPVLSGTDAWLWMVGGAGLASLVAGAYLAMFQQDLKGILAYSTISHLGLITLLLGMNSELALVAAVFHIMNHATFKASLFMAAGIIEHETGTRSLQRLSGLYRAMPVTATLALVAAASMAGVPLLNGFLSKEMFFTETLQVDSSGWQNFVLPIAATLGGMFSVAYSLRLVHQVFFGKLAKKLPRTPHDPTRWMLMPGALLVLACLLVGMLPAITVGPALQTAALSILGARTPQYSLAIWHGWTMPLLMSLIALAGGIVLYRLLGQLMLDGKAPVLMHFNAKRTFDSLMSALTVNADRGLRRLSSLRLQTQVLLLFLISLYAGLPALMAGGIAWGDRAILPLHPAFAMLWVVGAACSVAAAWQAKHHRFAALILSGGAGLATSLTFVWFSAPDLALTQLAVEVVTAVLILLGLRWLPRRLENYVAADEDGLVDRLRRSRDLVIAVVCGLCMAGLTFAILTRPDINSISRFFVERALSEGGGLNVVNVILVDFRAFDTFGEIAVLGIVALTVFALLRRFRPPPESVALPRQQQKQNAHEGIVAGALPDPREALPDSYLRLPAILVRLLLPLALLVSLFFLLRGHNAPGGGFVGGLIFATAIILQYMVSGTIWVEARLRLLPMQWIAWGLLVALLAGMMAWAAAQPFLSSQEWHGRVPLIGEIHLSSVLLFDIGVYMLVVGATILVLVALAHQSLRSHHRKVLSGAP